MTRSLLAAAILLAPALAHAEPDDAGPYAVQTDAYDLGDTAFAPINLVSPVEIRAAVYSPADLSEGPFPIVLAMHGRHSTCYDPENPTGTPGDGTANGGTGEWPCAQGRVAIPSHEGYAYFGELLASHGFIVVSVSANGFTPTDNASDDSGATARADLLNEHLVRWVEWNQGEDGPLGDRFVGAVDLERIGAMGHSRGGEGVAAFANADVADGKPYFIDAVLLLAPSSFNRIGFGNIPVGVVLPYCDGDLFALDGAHYFDDVRYLVEDDLTEKMSVTFMGANHNYFNTNWTPKFFPAGSGDDFAFLEAFIEPDAACGTNSSARLSSAEQRGAFGAYAAAFFRRHLADETEYLPVLRGEVVPESAAPAQPQVSYIGPAAEQLLVNAVDTETSLGTNALGGVVETDASFIDFCGLATDDMNASTYDHCVEDPGFNPQGYFEGRQPHTPGLGQLRLRLEDGEHWTNALPEGTDAQMLSVLQVRLGDDVDEGDESGELMIVLADHDGVEASVRASEYGDALRPQPGTMPNILPRKLLHSLRVPLDAFEGVDRSNLASISLRASGGAVSFLVSDLSFLDAPPQEPEPGTSTGAADTSGGPDTSGGTAGETEGSDSSGAPEPEPETSSTGELPAAGDGDGEGCSCTTGGAPSSGFALPLMVMLGLRRRKR